MKLPDLETALRYALLAVCVVGFVRYGSTKGTGTISVQNADTEIRYLADNGSYVTNSFVHVDLARSFLLPDDADFYCHYRPVGSTNDSEWVTLFTNRIGSVSFPTNIPFANAWSNNWIVGTSYVKKTSETNGVAKVYWIRIQDTSNAVPFRTRIYINGEMR